MRRQNGNIGVQKPDLVYVREVHRKQQEVASRLKARLGHRDGVLNRSGLCGEKLKVRIGLLEKAVHMERGTHHHAVEPKLLAKQVGYDVRRHSCGIIPARLAISQQMLVVEGRKRHAGDANYLGTVLDYRRKAREARLAQGVEGDRR